MPVQPYACVKIVNYTSQQLVIASLNNYSLIHCDFVMAVYNMDDI